ncbi:MAG TPA: peptidoglycan bridge formation glycyltransferase FemA/FemB family protein [Candidatus Woesebacteria bacterium]|nr:peptidoglycan bridge formation glycyltransferase FemA/FemB family protein [Candidatus Woesebacteria bacterium]
MIKIRKIKESDLTTWEDFVKNSNNGTIFHSLRFLSYHPPKRFKFHHLIFYKNNTLIACLPAGLNNTQLTSPLGGSYGSIITNNITFNEYEEIIDALIKYARAKKFTNITLTPPPVIYLKYQNQLESFLLEYKGFNVLYHLITNAVDLSTIDSNSILNSLTPMHKRAVKKSFNVGVTTSFSEDYSDFYKLLLKNKRKFNTTPTHTLKDIKYLTKVFPDSIKLLIAKSKEGQTIAGILLFCTNEQTVLAFYICHDYNYQHLRAVNRLFYDSITWAIANNYRWFDLGVSMDTTSRNVMEPSRNLISFKEGIGTRGFLRTTYSLNL